MLEPRDVPDLDTVPLVLDTDSDGRLDTSLVEAAKWHLIAKAAGETDGNLDKIVAKLSKADRAKAQKAADEWRERMQVGIE